MATAKDVADSMDAWGSTSAFLGVLGALFLAYAAYRSAMLYNRLYHEETFTLTIAFWLYAWLALSALLSGFWLRAVCAAQATSLRSLIELATPPTVHPLDGSSSAA